MTVDQVAFPSQMINYWTIDRPPPLLGDYLKRPRTNIQIPPISPFFFPFLHFDDFS